ncbi:hypothetical protein VNO80_26830 [Phaseolus coccineus]|uniref:Uncharacterized protein n=1 Tax=Phaseolus coccineus TaxID=3886 RepID=A0AAN9QEU0_PHACN
MSHRFHSHRFLSPTDKKRSPMWVLRIHSLNSNSRVPSFLFKKLVTLKHPFSPFHSSSFLLPPMAAPRYCLSA